MSTPAPPHEERLLLRADIFAGGDPVVAHTVILTPTEVVVHTESSPPVGSTITIELSLRGLVDTMRLNGVVLEHSHGTFPGDLRGFRMKFQFRSEDEARQVEALLARASQGHDQAPEVEYRVLLVEDNRLAREVFSHAIFRYFRHRVDFVTIDVAKDGAEAQELLAANRYDLAIIDYYLPVVNADLLVARLRAAPESADMAVVVVSVGGDDARRGALDAGADLFLDKPVVLKDLLGTLDKLAGTVPTPQREAP